MSAGSNFKSCASAIPPPGRILRFFAYFAVVCDSAISSCTSSCTLNRLFWSSNPRKQSGPATVKQQAHLGNVSRRRLSFPVHAASTLFRPAAQMHAGQLLADRALSVLRAGKHLDLYRPLAALAQLQPRHVAAVRTVRRRLTRAILRSPLLLLRGPRLTNCGPSALLFGSHSAPLRELKQKDG